MRRTQRYDVPQRPTRDADLLGFGPDDIEFVAAVFRDLCVIEVDDVIAFEVCSVKTAEIRKDAALVPAPVARRLQGGQVSYRQTFVGIFYKFFRPALRYFSKLLNTQTSYCWHVLCQKKCVLGG